MEDKRCLTCTFWDMWENYCMNQDSRRFQRYASPDGICEKWEDGNPTDEVNDSET